MTMMIMMDWTTLWTTCLLEEEDEEGLREEAEYREEEFEEEEAECREDGIEEIEVEEAGVGEAMIEVEKAAITEEEGGGEQRNDGEVEEEWETTEMIEVVEEGMKEMVTAMEDCMMMDEEGGLNSKMEILEMTTLIDVLTMVLTTTWQPRRRKWLTPNPSIWQMEISPDLRRTPRTSTRATTLWR